VRIVIEGPDGSGKSTLLNQFRERYSKLEMVPRACTSEHGPIDDLAGWVNEDFVSRTRGYWIYDRHPMISELIYSPAMGRDMNPQFQNKMWLSSAMGQFHSRGYYVIICLPPFEEVRDNVNANHGGTDHQDGVWANLKTIWNLYFIEQARRFNEPRSWVWDYTNMNFETSRMVDVFDSILRPFS